MPAKPLNQFGFSGPLVVTLDPRDHKLSRAYIKLTRPFREYKDQGLIHYFLDSLSQNPT